MEACAGVPRIGRRPRIRVWFGRCSVPHYVVPAPGGACGPRQRHGGPTALEGDGAAPTRQYVGTPRPAPGTEEPALPASANAPAPRAPGRPARRRRVRLPREGNRSDGFRSVRGSGLKSSVPISIGSELRINGRRRATGVGFHQMAGPGGQAMLSAHASRASARHCWRGVPNKNHSPVTLT